MTDCSVWSCPLEQPLWTSFSQERAAHLLKWPAPVHQYISTSVHAQIIVSGLLNLDLVLQDNNSPAMKMAQHQAAGVPTD